MKVRYPEYYEKFKCIAGECEDTCCAGWEIDIDDKTYEYYQKVSGEFGEKIRNHIKENVLEGEEEDLYESHGFILQEKKRCPFLNKDNLCEIIINLGEEAICDVCTDTPRNFLEYGNVREISLSPSCAEAGRLLFSQKETIHFMEKEVDGSLELVEEGEDLEFSRQIKIVRDNAISILQNRNYDLDQRIAVFLLYAQKIQEKINIEEYDKLNQVSYQEIFDYKKIIHTEAERFQLFCERITSLSGMESINQEWNDNLEEIKCIFIENENGEKRYEDMLNGYTKYLRQHNREYELENVLVYYAFLCLARCVDDDNFWGKAQLVISSFLTIRDMDLLRFYKNSHIFSLEDRVEITKAYAKEVEHSRINLDYLEEEFLFEPIYHLEELCIQSGCYSMKKEETAE